MDNNFIETTLIGTGGGYGESIVVCVGHQNWIVIDSCIDPDNSECLPLKYLESINVDIEKDVKLIVCTHWHDDHIRGISKLYEKAINSKLAVSQATDKKKFFQVLKLDQNKVQDKTSMSSTTEFSKCLEILDKRGKILTRSVADKTLYSFLNSKIDARVISLSPSDLVIQEFESELTQLMEAAGRLRNKVVVNSPNDKSIVLLIKINNIRILLGSDLEVTSDHNKGWHCIMKNSEELDSKSSVFKIPHHGSETGYDKTIWENLIDSNAIAKLSPWNLGNTLPKPEMLETILSHSSDLYITSLNQFRRKPKKRRKTINKTIETLKPDLVEIKFEEGIVQCRMNIDSQNPKWNVVLLNEAKKVTQKEITKLSLENRHRQNIKRI